MGLSVFPIANDGDGDRLNDNMECGIVVSLLDRIVATGKLTNTSWLGKHVHCIFFDEASLLYRQQSFRKVVSKFFQQLSGSNSMVGTSSVGETKAKAAICILDATVPCTVGNNMCDKLSQLFLGVSSKDDRVEFNNEYKTDEFIDEEKARIEVEVVAINGKSEDEENDLVVVLIDKI